MDDVFAGESIDSSLSASEAFVQQLTTQVNRSDIRSMVLAQNHMLQRFEKTNEMLLNFNALSKGRYETTQQDFRNHTVLLSAMKKDLDAVFKRIRLLKSKLGKQYPDAFKACSDVYDVMEEDEDELTVTSGAQTPVTPKILMQSSDGDEFSTPVHMPWVTVPGVQSSSTADAGTSQNTDNISQLSQNFDRTSTSTIVEEAEELQTDSTERT